MVYSMTAFARDELEAEWGAAAWELRTVNHRYLDVSLRLPEEFRSLEPRARERIAARMRRGKVDGSLRLRPASDGPADFVVNVRVLDRLLAAMRQVERHRVPSGSSAAAYRKTPPALERPTALDLLRWPGVLEPPEFDRESAGVAVLGLLDRTLDGLVEARGREGRKLGALIEARCGEAADIAARVRAALPEVRERYRTRLLARLDEARVDLDPNRLAQEVVLFASRTDAAEELDRLDAHLAEVRSTLASRAPIGRRLDFLMQELQREANTLGSKSADSSVSGASVDLKVLVEQMREQVQNIE